MQPQQLLKADIQTEVASAAFEQAAQDEQLPLDEILDRFTLALARQMAKEDHEKAVTEQTSKKDQRL